MFYFPYSVDIYYSRKPLGSILAIVVCVIASIAFPVLVGSGVLRGETLSWFVLDGWNPIGWVGHIFLHGGPGHLFWNMYFLWLFGSAVCEIVGNKLFFAVFVGLGVAGGIVHVLLDGTPAVGASGAINGLIGMFLIFYPINKVHVFYFVIIGFRSGSFAISSYWLILIWFGLDLWGALDGKDTGVAYWAHVGGFVAGVGLATLLLKKGWVTMGVYDNPNLLDYMGLGKVHEPHAPLLEPRPPLRDVEVPDDDGALELNCPHCDQLLEVANSLLGTTFDCPTCEGAIELAEG